MRVPTSYLLLHTIIYIQFHILRLQMGPTTFKPGEHAWKGAHDLFYDTHS